MSRTSIAKAQQNLQVATVNAALARDSLAVTGSRINLGNSVRIASSSASSASFARGERDQDFVDGRMPPPLSSPGSIRCLSSLASARAAATGQSVHEHRAQPGGNGQLGLRKPTVTRPAARMD
jgi:hypothetical protein